MKNVREMDLFLRIANLCDDDKQLPEDKGLEKKKKSGTDQAELQLESNNITRYEDYTSLNETL